MTPDEIRLLREQKAVGEKAALEKRMQAGARGELWHLSVYYELDKEKRVLHTDNLFTHEMNSFRENLFFKGLMVPFEPNCWRIIPPACIGDIYITKQSKFFE